MAAPASAKIKELQAEQPSNRNTPGSNSRTYFTARLEDGKTPYDEVSMGDPQRHHRQRQRLGDLRAARHRSPCGLVADRHQYRRQ